MALLRTIPLAAVAVSLALTAILPSCKRSDSRPGSGVLEGEPADNDSPGEDPLLDVWVLFNETLQDTLLTTSASEREKLIASGHWVGVCESHGQPSANCGSTQQSLFQTWKEPGKGRRALYRCLGVNRHFFSLDPACEAFKTESLLGYLAKESGKPATRALHRCYRQGQGTGNHFAAIDAPCSSAKDEGAYGFVAGGSGAPTPK